MLIHVTYTLKELNNVLRQMFSRKFHVSSMTVFPALEDEFIDLKEAQNIPQNRISLKVNEQRAAYANWMFKEGIQKMLIAVYQHSNSFLPVYVRLEDIWY